MDYKDKSKEELIIELENLRAEYHDLKKLYVSSVSDLKRTEETLEESETKFRKIFEEGPLGMAIVDNAFKFLVVNTTFSKVIGYSENELYHLRFVDITHPQDINKDTQNVHKLMQHEISVYNTEKRYVRKDGQEIWAKVTVSPIFNDNHQFLYFLALIEEVSARKHIEDTLSRVAERLKMATRSANIGIWDWHINTPKLLWDDQMYELYGIVKGDSGITLKEWVNMMHPDDVLIVRDIVNRSVNDKTDFNIEYRTIWPDKSVHWIKAVGHVYFDAKGEPERMLGVNYDITKQKESAHSLEESKYLLAASLNSMDVGVFITDAKGRIIEYNERFSSFFNIGPESENNKREIDLHDYIEAYTITGEILAPEEWAVPSALRGEIAKNKECILKRKDTGVTYICSYCYAPLYQNAHIMGAVVSVIDITTQKQVEKALNKSHDLLLNLARLVPGVIYQYRLYPDGRSAFPYSSPGMYDIYEVTPDEVREDATPVFGRLHPEDYDNIVNKIMHSAETLEIFYCEFRVILPQKGLQWRWSQAHPERMDDGGTLWHGIISDITERKEGEILLRRKSEEFEAQNIEYQQLNDKLLQTNEKLKEAKELAEQSDKLKTVFLQNMSHEIRTPMNAIMGFAELLGKHFNNKERIEKYVKIINQRCHDLLEIITEILDFAKIESGQLPLMVLDCKINALFFDLQEFFSEYQHRQCKEHIKLDFRPIDNLPGDTIRTDAVKLKQILINLIANALKFTNKGSIVVECTVESESLLFSVADTGIGIPDEKKEYIFERFAQLEPQPGHVYGGTGLGLSIVKGLLNMLGGKVWLESEVGKGTTFYFSLPLYYPEVGLIKKHTQEVENFVFSNKTILIVEDDLCNAEYLKESLRETGAELLHTEFGKEAVNIATTEKVDLILMDIRLPDMDGYIASKLIKQSNPDIIIISQTAYAAYEDRKKSLDAGCDDYISKPAKQEALLAIIKKYLQIESIE